MRGTVKALAFAGALAINSGCTTTKTTLSVGPQTDVNGQVATIISQGGSRIELSNGCVLDASTGHISDECQ